jgi:hypothetical protein
VFRVYCKLATEACLYVNISKSRRVSGFQPLTLATVVYLALGRYEESIAAAEAALGHVRHRPRAQRVLEAAPRPLPA